MNRYLIIPLLKGLSLLPLPLLYGVSNCLFFLLFRVLKYRRNVVFSNLTNSFPEKEIEELEALEKKYYKYLSDLIVEVIKGHSISAKDLVKRVEFQNPELWRELEKSKEPIVLVMGHMGNWEWLCMAANLLQSLPVQVVYKTLSSADFEHYMNNMRGKNGAKLIPMEKVLRHMIAVKNTGSLNCFVADQNPPSGERAYWVPFLHQDTAVLKGTEKVTKLLNCKLVYADMRRSKRGQYQVHTKVLTETPQEFKEAELTQLFMQELEKSIALQPELWLWSHKRWKHSRK